MIAIKKSENKNEIPSSLESQKCKDNLNKVVDLTNPKHKDNIKSEFYGAKDVREKLKKLYHNKCAYCETYEPEPEIEHYRPKKQINGILRKDHKGYYWLAYEWTNLLPACHDCNKNGAKGNHFPIEGTRKFNPENLSDGSINLSANKLTGSYLQTEKPLFLNPETSGFDPFNYFIFDKTGLFKAKKPENTFEYRQAKTTINIVQLNRDKLYSNYRKLKIRKIFLGKFRKRLFLLINRKINNKIFKELIFEVLDEIKNNSKPDKEYSFFWSYLYKNFSYFITHYFDGKFRIPFLKCYKEHKAVKNL